MCQYRYYYYGGCQHQETVLYDFCAKAVPTVPDSESDAAPATASTHPSCQEEGSANDNGNRATSTAAPSASDLALLRHPSSNLAVPLHPRATSSPASPSPTSPSSLLPYSSTSSRKHTSNSSTFIITRDSHGNSPPEAAMAGLAPFSNSNLRQLMTGKSIKMATPATALGDQELDSGKVCSTNPCTLTLFTDLTTSSLAVLRARATNYHAALCSPLRVPRTPHACRSTLATR